MDAKLWGQEDEQVQPKRSSFSDIFDNIGAWGRAAYADTMAIPMGRQIKDVYDKIENGQYSSREEYDSLVADLDRLQNERNEYRDAFNENQKILNQNDSYLKDFTEIGGTVQGIGRQARDTLIGAGLGAIGGSVVPVAGTASGAMTGARIGNFIGSIDQAAQDADTNAIDAWEKVLQEGGTSEQAEQAYKDAFWNNMPTEALDILSSLYMGGKLLGSTGKILNRALGGKLAGTLANGVNKAARFDLPAKLGTYVANKSGKAWLGQGVGVGLGMLGNAVEEGVQEPWQDYATERAVDIQRRQYDPTHEGIRDFSVFGDGGLLDYYTTPEGMNTAIKAAKMGAAFGGVGGLMSKSQFTELGTAHSDSIQSAKREADWIDKQGLLKDAGNLERYNNVKETMANVYDLSEDEKADLSVEDVARMYHEYYTNLFGQGGNRQEQNAVSQADFLNEITGEETARRGLMGDTATKYIDEFGIRPDNETLVGINDNQQVLSEEQVQETLNQDEEETTGEETENKEGIKAKASKPDFFDDKTSEQAKEEKASSETQNVIQKKKKGIPDKFGNWKKIEENDEFDHDLNNIGAEAKYENAKTGRIANIKRTKAGYQVTDITDPKDQGTTRNKKGKKKLLNFLKSPFANQKTKFMSDGTQEQEQVSQALPQEDGVIATKDITKDENGDQWFNGKKIQSNKAQTIHSMQDLHDYYKTHKDLMSKDLYAEISRQMMRFGIGNANNTEIVLDLTNREAGGFGSETTIRTDPNDENSAVAKAIVRLYAGADLATAAHEMAHLGWMNLSDQDRATFTKWAEKTQGEFIAKILGMDYDQNFRSYLIEALTNRESQASQDLWEKIKREGAVQQTLGILNGQNYGLAVEERFAWEFSNWYAQGYIKGAKPRNIIERILNKACATLQGALNLLTDTNRYLNGENGYNGGDINNIFTNMSTRGIGQQRQTVAPQEQVETVTRMDYAPEMGYDLAQGLPNVADSELGMTLDEEPEQNLSGNFGTTRVNQKAERTAQEKTKTGYGEGVANNNETLEQYRERMKKEAEQKKEEKKQNYTPTPKYKPKERNRKVGGYEQTSPQGETLEQYKQREAEEAEKYKVPTSLKGVRKLLTIVKNRKEGWQRALQSLKQIDPRKFRSIKTQIGNDLWGVSEDYVNDGNDLWGQPKQQSLFGEEFEETKSEPKTQVEENTEETKKTNAVEEPSLFDNQTEQVSEETATETKETPEQTQEEQTEIKEEPKEQVSTTTEDTETEETKETSQNEEGVKEEAIHKFAKKWRPENQTPAKVLKSKGYRFNEKQKDSAIEYKIKILGILKGDDVLNKLKKEKEELENKVKEYKSQFEDALTHGKSTEEITRNWNLYKYLLEYVKDAEKVMSGIQEKQNKSTNENTIETQETAERTQDNQTESQGETTEQVQEEDEAKKRIREEKEYYEKKEFEYNGQKYKYDSIGGNFSRIDGEKQIKISDDSVEHFVLDAMRLMDSPFYNEKKQVFTLEKVIENLQQKERDAKFVVENTTKKAINDKDQMKEYMKKKGELQTKIADAKKTIKNLSGQYNTKSLQDTVNDLEKELDKVETDIYEFLEEQKEWRKYNQEAKRSIPKAIKVLKAMYGEKTSSETKQTSLSDEEFNKGLEKIKDSKNITFKEDGKYSFNDEKIAKEIFGDKELSDKQKSNLFSAISQFAHEKSVELKREHDKKKNDSRKEKSQEAFDKLHKKYKNIGGKIIGDPSHRFKEEERSSIQYFMGLVDDHVISGDLVKYAYPYLEKNYESKMDELSDREKKVYDFMSRYLSDAEKISDWLDNKEQPTENKSETETPVQNSQVEQPVATKSEPVETETATEQVQQTSTETKKETPQFRESAEIDNENEYLNEEQYTYKQLSSKLRGKNIMKEDTAGNIPYAYGKRKIEKTISEYTTKVENTENENTIETATDTAKDEISDAIEYLNMAKEKGNTQASYYMTQIIDKQVDSIDELYDDYELNDLFKDNIDIDIEEEPTVIGLYVDAIKGNNKDAIDKFITKLENNEFENSDKYLKIWRDFRDGELSYEQAKEQTDDILLEEERELEEERLRIEKEEKEKAKRREDFTKNAKNDLELDDEQIEVATNMFQALTRFIKGNVRDGKIKFEKYGNLPTRVPVYYEYDINNGGFGRVKYEAKHIIPENELRYISGLAEINDETVFVGGFTIQRFIEDHYGKEYKKTEEITDAKEETQTIEQTNPEKGQTSTNKQKEEKEGYKDPKIMKYIPKDKQEAVSFTDIDGDDGSYWVYLKEGWCNGEDRLTGIVHERTLKEVKDKARNITRVEDMPEKQEIKEKSREELIEESVERYKKMPRQQVEDSLNALVRAGVPQDFADEIKEKLYNKTKTTPQAVNEGNIENNTKTQPLTEQQNQTNAETKQTTIDKSDKNYQKAVELVIKNRGMSATGLRLTLKDEGIVVGQEKAEQYLVQMENDGIVEHGDEGSLRMLKKNPSTKMQEAGQNAENQTLLTPQVEEELENLFWKLIRKKQFHGMDSRWESGKLDYYRSLSNRRQGKEFNPEFIKGDKAFLNAIKNVNDYIHEKFPQYKNVYRGVDGHWRFEFSDKDAQFINGFEKLSGKTLDTTLDKILKHDNLYKFYSKLKGMPVHLVRNTKMQEIMEDTEHNYYAMYDPDEKAIYINSDMFESNDEVRNSLLHEIQHAIQDIEGFANGTNDNAYNNDYDFSEGEKQAVLTEKRSNMSDEELQQNPRSKTLNPNEKTIIQEQRPVQKVAKTPSTKFQSSGQNNLGYIDKQKDIYSVTFTKSAQQNAENKKKMDFYRKNKSYWRENKDAQTGSITFTRALPYQQHQKTIIYDEINGKKVGKRKKAKWREYYEAFKDHVIKWLFNDKHFLEKAARNVGAIESYMRMMVMKDQGAVAGAAIEDGIVKHNGKNGERTKSLNSIIEAVGEENQTDFLNYCEAYRVLDLEKRNIYQKMTPEKARDEIAKVKRSKNAKLFEEQRKNFVEYNHELLWVLVDGGFITEKQYDNFIKIDPNFIPLAKNMDELEGYVDGFRDSKTMINVAHPMHKIGTSMREVANPFLEMQKRTVEYYVKASRNKAGHIFVHDIAEAIAQNAKGDVVAQNQGMVRKLASRDKNGKPISHDNKQYVFYVWENGEKQYYQVADREIYVALKSFDAEQMGALSKIMNATAGKASRLVRNTATMTPDFGLRNLVRDNMEAFISSEHGFLPLVDSLWGMYQMANDTQWFKEYQRMNGEHLSLNRDGEDVATVEHDIKDNVKFYKTIVPLFKKDLHEFMDKDRSKPARAKSLLKLVALDIVPLQSIYKANKRLNDYLETGTRIGEYRNARMGYKGLKGRLFETNGSTIWTTDMDLSRAKNTEMIAAYKSKDITLNFGQHGVLGKELNRYIPFFNASLQGIYKLGNTLDDMIHAEDARRRQELMFKCALMGAMGMAAALAGQGDDDYDEAPDYEHENFWILPNGIRIPKDQLFGKLIGGTVEKATAQYLKDGDVKKLELVQDVLGNFAIDKCVPALVDLGWGTIGNYDSFKKKSVTPEYMADKLGYLQKDLSTSKAGADISETIYKVTDGLFKALGYNSGGVDIGAKKVDFVISKTLSNLGKYATSLWELTGGNEKMTRGAEVEDKGGFAETSKELPYPMNQIVGTFATNRNSFQSISDFYERHRELKKLSSDESIMSKNEKKAWEAYQAAYKKDKQYRDALKAIKLDKSLTGAQKRQKADKIFKQQISMARKLHDWEKKHGLI